MVGELVNTDHLQEQCSHKGEPAGRPAAPGEGGTAMGRHVIVGAGPVGTATAHALVAAGHEVTVVTMGDSPPTDRPVPVEIERTR